MKHPVPLTLAALSGLALLAAGCAAAQEPQDDRLTVATAFPPRAGLSPFSDDAFHLTRLGIAETLTSLDDAGEPVGLLAESWERLDDSTVEFELREGATFQDGTALAAEHVAEVLQRAAEDPAGARALAGQEIEATATGERTLEIASAEADPILPQRLSSPELVILAPAAYEEDVDSPDAHGTGTGPFVLEQLDGTSSATLQANADYHGGTPAASGVDVRFVQDPGGRVGALRAGEVDLIDAVPVAHMGELEDAAVVEVDLPRSVMLYLNTDQGPFADPGLRAAARDAADPHALAEGVYEGETPVGEAIFGPASPWAESRPDVSPGQAQGADGEQITLATYDDRAELPEMASALAEDLRGVGFEVDVVVQEYGMVEGDLLAGEFDAFILSRSYDLDTGDPVSYLASDFTCDGGYNLAHLCDEDLDALIAEAASVEDLAERQSAALEAEARILELDAVVPLVHERARLGLAPGIDGVAEDPLERSLITVDTGK